MDEQMKELDETGRLTLSDAQLIWRGKEVASTYSFIRSY
jgi:hypothetical protein